MGCPSKGERMTEGEGPAASREIHAVAQLADSRFGHIVEIVFIQEILDADIEASPSGVETRAELKEGVAAEMFFKAGPAEVDVARQVFLHPESQLAVLGERPVGH